MEGRMTGKHVEPIDIGLVACPECGSHRVTVEFRVALATVSGAKYGWSVVSDYQPMDGGGGICDACEYTGPTDTFRTEGV